MSTTPAANAPRPPPGFNSIRAPTQGELEATYASIVNSNKGTPCAAPTDTQLRGRTAFAYRDGEGVVAGNKTMYVIDGELFLKTVPANQKMPKVEWRSFGKPQIRF